MSLDRIDIALLQLLRKNARLPNKTLAERVGIGFGFIVAVRVGIGLLVVVTFGLGVLVAAKAPAVPPESSATDSTPAPRARP